MMRMSEEVNALCLSDVHRRKKKWKNAQEKEHFTHKPKPGLHVSSCYIKNVNVIHEFWMSDLKYLFIVSTVK